MFDSVLKRQFEEEEARKAAGLSAFKATGNSIQDAFRKMLETKMLEKFKSEMRGKELEELDNRKKIADQIEQREVYLNEQTIIMQERHKIELQTQIEAKEDAQRQAKLAVRLVSLAQAKKAGMVDEKKK